MFRLFTLTMLLLVSCSAFAAAPMFKDGLKLYLQGDVTNAIQVWQQLADDGDIQAQKQLGQYYLTNHQHRDYEQSIAWYSRASTQGDEDSVEHLKNVLKIYDTWHELASEIGSAAAYSTITFREHLHEGADTHCGFVIKVKSKVVLIQTDSQPRWFRKNDIYSPDVKNCAVDT